jgi:hypothetical protein
MPSKRGRGGQGKRFEPVGRGDRWGGERRFPRKRANEPLAPRAFERQSAQALNSMIIHNLHLQNYRGFVDRSFEFNPEFTLLIGENGSGKSAVLRACATLLGDHGFF